MPLHTQLIAIQMNPKLFLLSKIIHLFQNCVHSKKIVNFQYNYKDKQVRIIDLALDSNYCLAHKFLLNSNEFFLWMNPVNYCAFQGICNKGRRSCTQAIPPPVLDPSLNINFG